MLRHRPLAFATAFALAVPISAHLGCAGAGAAEREDAPATEPGAQPEDVQSRAASPRELQQPGEFAERDDESIADRTQEQILATRVRLALLRDLADDALPIGVEVKGDDVVIAGAVDTEELRQEAIRTVRGVDGVDLVSSQLIVPEPDERAVQDEPRLGEGIGAIGESAADELSATTLELYLLQGLGADALQVDVEVEEDDIVLQGYVPTRQAAREAEDIARRFDARRQVDNRLEVPGEAG